MRNPFLTTAGVDARVLFTPPWPVREASREVPR